MSPVPEHRRGWTIDVCRTCDRLARFPFCEHRDQPPPPAATSWCVSVSVIPASRRDRTVADPPRGPAGFSPEAGRYVASHPRGMFHPPTCPGCVTDDEPSLVDYR